MFHVRRRPADYVPRKRKKKPAGKWSELDHRYEDERLPFLLELNPDGTDIPNGAGTRHRLQPNVTEVGSERPVGPQAVQAQTLTLTGSTVMPRHCVIAFTENIVTLTPCSRDAHTYVNNQRIHQTTILQNGAIIKFGRTHTFRFIDPVPEDRMRQRHDSNRQLDYTYDRRSPDVTGQEVSSEKYRPRSGTPNGGHGSNPPSPTKSAAASPRSPTHNAHTPETTHNYETTFDLDGNVETASLTSSRDGNRLSQYDRHSRGTDPILPAVLEFLEETEETFLHAVITDVEPSAPQFRLAPTYTLYLAARYRASTHYRPELQPTERAHKLTVMLAKVATMIQRVIQERYMDASSLAFWLANGSELLHMLKSDRHVGAFSTRAQDILADAVHAAFASLVRCVSLELAPAMSQFMADADEPAKEAGVLQIFSNTMALLRRCRVNAALTIQLFSHLFHAINAAAFNALVSNGNLCVRWFGRRLKARLNALETWAERQGLELASQCHLATIMQATHLLQAPKYNAEELATLSSTCFKLNSLQVRALLQKYQPAADEPRLPAELIENVVRVAESVADTLARADGREIRLEEEPTLALALLLPEDGYSCEVIRGVPPGLAEFLAPLQRDGLCRMAAQPTSSGYWTIYMIDHHANIRSPSAMSNRSGGYSGHISQIQGQPEIQIIKFHKSTNGMGLSIVAAKGAGQDRLGIYIKSVVAGGAADADGRLTAGDQLLKVDGQSLIGITQEKAAEYLVRTGPIVTLEVSKQGAIYHGLATLLSQPSPAMTRAHKGRPRSEHLEPPRLPEMAPQPSTSHSMGNLLSVPKQAAYQERLVDWDVDHVQPGATVAPFQIPKAQYYNYYQSAPAPQSYEAQQSFAPLPQSKVASRQIVNPANFAMRSLDGAPLDAKNVRPRNYRQIPIIQEPSQMFLTIPSHVERYPPYPVRNTPQYGYYSEDKTELIFPTKNRAPESNFNSVDAEVHESAGETAGHRTVVSFDNEAYIPYIDQFEEISERSKQPARTISVVDENAIDVDRNACARHSDAYANSLNRRRETPSTRSLAFDLRGDISTFSTNLNSHLDKVRVKTIDIVEIASNETERRLCSAAKNAGTRSDIDSAMSRTCHGRCDHSDRNTNKLINDEFGAENSPAEYKYPSSDDPCDGSNASDSVESRQENARSRNAVPTPEMHTIMPELNLDLSGLNSGDVSSEDSTADKCWKSPEEVRLGCGRVAALAKHFSKLGEAGLIKFKSKKFVGSRRFVSEPDIASPRSPEAAYRRKADIKPCKSEMDLLRSDKSVATTPEREWSMILLDIQARSDREAPGNQTSRSRCKDESTSTEANNLDRFSSTKDSAENSDVLDASGYELRKSSSKLSLAEQQEIIEQLKEFSNLDNTDAPLFIPEQSEETLESADDPKTFNSDKETMTESNTESLTNDRDNTTASQSYHHHTVTAGAMRLEHLRKHSIPAILSTLNISPGFELTKKMNKLEKYWSLKDLMHEDPNFDGSNTTEDSPKYFIFPTCSRVVSAPEMLDENVNIFRIRSSTPNSGSGNVTIRSTISIGEEETSDKECSKSETDLFSSNTREQSASAENVRVVGDVHGNEETVRRKFPASFIRTRKRMSKSCDELCDKADTVKSSQLSKESTCKSLDKLPVSGTRKEASTEFRSSSGCKNKSFNSKPALRASIRVKSCEAVPTSATRCNAIVPASRNVTKISKPIRKKSLIIGKKSKSDLDVSERKPTPRFERGDWIFREFPPLETDSDSRPRRMSERDLPSRLGHDTTPQQIHSSKSVPALHNVGTEGKQQHEVFNPGYSRASSSNSVTPPVQPPPMPAMNGATTLRSRSSHNLHDPMRAGALPPTGLVSRQQSSPNLTPSQMHANIQNSLQSNEAERFYQNLSVYRNQDPSIKQQQQQQPSPPQQQQPDDRSPLHAQKNLRGSQNSLNRPLPTDVSQGRDRPISAYIPQSQQQFGYSNSQLQQPGPPPRSQSSRDIIRQEAKLQEMQEEVRRRELRGGAPALQYRPNMYNTRPMTAAQTANAVRPARPIGSTPNLGPNSPTYGARQVAPSFGYPEPQYGGGQYNQFGKHQQQTTYGQYGMIPKGKNESGPVRAHGTPMESGRDFAPQDPNRQYSEQNRPFGSSQNGSQYSNGPADPRSSQYSSDGVTSRTQNGDGGVQGNPENPPPRPHLPEEGYRESPPPPPPNTSTHPLYSKQDSRYTASMQDPPRGGYYPTVGSAQQPRQYQYSATNPWDREEKEKEQARKREAVRQWRSQQIAELIALPQRTPQQEEQLRALQLERDFQKRAEEAANQQDDDEESNDLDHESTQRVQGLLRMAATQDRNQNQAIAQQHNLSRTSAGNQSARGALSPQPVGSQLQSTNVLMHTASSQQGPLNPGNSYTGQNDGPAAPLGSLQNQSQAGVGQVPTPMSPGAYGSSLGQQQGTSQKPAGVAQINEDRERQRRIDELKRKQAEFDENQKKREEEIRQQQHQLQLHQQQMQQLYQQQQLQQQQQQQQQHQSNLRTQQQLHPGMLRLDNLVINGPSSPPSSQNGGNDVAPPPPERGSSYAVMSQQSSLRSNTSASSNLPIGAHQTAPGSTATIKRVSFHDPNANTEPSVRGITSGTNNAPSTITMDSIREDPNNFINDAENMLASPKTPEGPSGPFSNPTPGVIGAQEVYKDPRQKRLAEKQKQQQNSQMGAVPEKLSFKEKMKMFAMETGEDGTPRDKVKISRAQRDIDNIGSPVSPNNNNNRS